MPEEPPYPCPCCGYRVFREQPGSYDNCPVCGWEDDLSQLRFPTTGGANAPLMERQRARAHNREPDDATFTPGDVGYAPDPEWRPLDLDLDEVERPSLGVDYGLTYLADHTRYYYWRWNKSE